MKPSEILSKNVKVVMASEGETTSSLSKKCNVPQKTIWTVSRATSVPTVNTAVSMCDALGCDLAAMLTDGLAVSQLLSSKQDGKIVSKIRMLNPNNKATIINMIDALLQQQITS